MEIARGRRAPEPLQATPLPLLLARDPSVAGRRGHSQEQTRINSTHSLGWGGGAGKPGYF